jgi:hypothetical protein
MASWPALVAPANIRSRPKTALTRPEQPALDSDTRSVSVGYVEVPPEFAERDTFVKFLFHVFFGAAA